MLRGGVHVRAEMRGSFKGLVCDPCCGAAGVCVQSAEYLAACAIGNSGRAGGQVSIYSQRENYTIGHRVETNLAIQNINGCIDQNKTFWSGCFSDRKGDYILVILNMTEWDSERRRITNGKRPVCRLCAAPA